MITTCDFRQLCPIDWTTLPDLPDGTGKHCPQCQRPVLVVHNRRQFTAAARRGDCVAFFPEGKETAPRLTGVPLPPPVPSELGEPIPGETPPYVWSEIEECLARPTRAPRGDTRPAHRPPCPRCQRPMRWIYFRSHPKTWEFECGRAGWTPICRDCRTWLRCQITIMS